MRLLVVLLAFPSPSPPAAILPGGGLRDEGTAEPPTVPAGLVERARQRAAEGWRRPPEDDLPAALAELDYDGYRRLRFDPDAALWRREARRFEVRFHHRGYLFRPAVALHEVTPEGPRVVPYDPAAFSVGETLPPPDLGPDFGFAGFRVHYPLESPETRNEVASFLGASYFRLISEGQVWGASTRGLAIDTGRPDGEEFPAFVEFWIERPETDARELVVHALLDSPGAAGAYTIRLAPGAETTAAVSARLFTRHAISKLGIAPLTSMFLFGETSSSRPPDYRPEVHDSDGLLVHGGDGQWTWRPLANPPEKHRFTRFEGEGLRGFGLMQRDRRFESYQDLESRFERRPSLWVEPLGDWGAGAVELIEIPSRSEGNDNVVAFWVPADPVKREAELSFAYLLRATSADAVLHEGLRVHATRRARAPGGGTRFVVDFVGPGKSSAGAPAPVADFTGSEVEIERAEVVANTVTGGWRVVFDVRPADGREHSLRLRLAPAGDGGEAAADAPAFVAETWTYVVRQREEP